MISSVAAPSLRWTARVAWATAPALVAVLAAAFLWREFRAVSPIALAQAVAGLGAGRIVAATAMTAVSFVLIAALEVLGLAWAGAKPPVRRAAAAALCATTVGQLTTFGFLAAAAVRARRYAGLERPAEVAAKIGLFYAVAFGLGMAVLCGLGLLRASDPHWGWAGAALLAAPAAYVAACAGLRGQLQLAGRRLSLPAPGLAAAQAALGVADCAAAAAVFWLLLPAGASTFADAVGPYALATGAGLASHSPAGVGVFEAVLSRLLPGVDRPQLAAAIIGYRIIYYALPLAAAGLAVALEARPARLEPWRRLWRSATPLAAAAGAFAVGALLILTGVGRIAPDRVAVLRATIPVAVLEASHLVCLIAGLTLMVSALGLLRRRSSAWLVALAACAVAASTALLRGLDIGPSICATALALLLGVSRQRFGRRGTWRDRHWTFWWLAGLIAVVVGAAALGLWIYADTPYETRLWADVGYHADPARFLRTLAVLGAGVLAAGVWTLLRPGGAPAVPASVEDLEAVRSLVETSPDSTARLALLGDKAILRDPQDRAFVMYAAAGSSLVVMGDPVGEPQAGLALLWRLKEIADASDSRLVVYHAGPHWLTAYLDLGLMPIKLGEEARVDLRTFSLAGGRRRNLRQTHAKAVRDGLAFELARPPHSAALLAQLREISESWLAARGGREKSFSLGWFDPAILAASPIALVRAQGQVQAFANVWTVRDELSVDLMRHRAGACHGVMDFLFVELMAWGKAADYAWFNLGVAPLSGLVEHPLAPVWHKLGSQVARRAGRFYGFAGLRSFKAKFDPVWRPRYLAAPPFSLAAALVDVSRLVNRAPPVVSAPGRDHGPLARRAL